MENTELKKEFPLMIPSITSNDIAAVTAVLKTGMLIQGKNVSVLEESIQTITTSKHGIAVSNGTATMHLALIALGVKPGDEVIIPAFSYIATANVVELVGAKPVFVDIDPATFNIDVNKIEAAITPRTRVIMPVHEFGLACDISQVMEIAKKYRLHVIEDAACALGAHEGNKPVGSFGVFGSFSLHPRKSVTSGEGGIITTNDEDLARKVAILRNHGIDNSTGVMEFVAAGYNYRMTDFQAALVNSQLRRFDEVLRHKHQLALVYLKELDENIMQLPMVPGNKNHTWQTFHIVLDKTTNRDVLIAALKKKGIGANYGAQCIPSTQYYQQKYGHDSAREFPNAYLAFSKGLAIPMYYGLETNDVKYIAKEINKSIKDA